MRLLSFLLLNKAVSCVGFCWWKTKLAQPLLLCCCSSLCCTGMRMCCRRRKAGNMNYSITRISRLRNFRRWCKILVTVGPYDDRAITGYRSPLSGQIELTPRRCRPHTCTVWLESYFTSRLSKMQSMQSSSADGPGYAAQTTTSSSSDLLLNDEFNRYGSAQDRHRHRKASEKNFLKVGQVIRTGYA